MSLDARVIAERVAEVVNRKLGEFDRRLGELEAKLKKLELDVYLVRGQTIESVVRSVLSVKIDDIVSAAVSKALANLSDIVETAQVVGNEARNILASLRTVAEKLQDLPQQITEVVRSEVASRISCPSTEEVAEAVERRLVQLAKNATTETVKSLATDLAEMKTSIEKLRNDIASLTRQLDDIASKLSSLSKEVEYVRRVASLLEERIRRAMEGES